jgi:hypothetical protein
MMILALCNSQSCSHENIKTKLPRANQQPMFFIYFEGKVTLWIFDNRKKKDKCIQAVYCHTWPYLNISA